MRKCIEHQWIRGNRHIPTVMKYGSFARAMWVCEAYGTEEDRESWLKEY